jgi:hypothetical protein
MGEMQSMIIGGDISMLLTGLEPTNYEVETKASFNSCTTPR